MSNILFSKKFLAKLTAIIRNFWWTGVKEEPTTKTLCLRAWADICREKKLGGLGVRNLQAINQSLILSAAWRLAKEPQSQLALILKSKYHSDTTIWRAKPNRPKSAFWTVSRYNPSYSQLLSTNLLMAAPLFGVLHGSLVGNLFMIISLFNLLLMTILQLLEIFGSLMKKLGMSIWLTLCSVLIQPMRFYKLL
jgi:hypothetical protein